MFRVLWVKVREHERGLLFRDRTFVRVLGPGRHLLAGRVRVDRVSVRDPWLSHPDLEVMVRSGALGDEAVTLDLEGHERGLVWVDGRFSTVCTPGVYALWTVFKQVRTEVVDARAVRFDHPELPMILAAAGSSTALESVQVEAGQVGLLLVDGRLRETLEPGAHAFWRGVGRVKVLVVDRREQSLDVAGQELMTADRVTLRLNALVTYRVVDPVKAATEVTDHAQALYRQAQLALREVVGGRELNHLLVEREQVAAELTGEVRRRAEPFGVRVDTLGIRDVILPGEMKELLNRVTEAKTAAEAALITRREETAAMRSQLNTARLLESSATLMRLKELEVLEKVAGTGQLTVVLGDTGLTDRVVKLL